MKATGIIRNIDELGRLVIPKEMRRSMDIGTDDPMEIFVDEDKIVLKKYEPTCIFCGAGENVILFREKRICADCIHELCHGR